MLILLKGEGVHVASQTRSFHQTKTDIIIGVMSLVLYMILAAAFLFFLSLNNPFLRVINRTTGTTLLTFFAMTFSMHAVYGGFDVGRKKSRPVISAMVMATAVTDLVTYVQYEIMNATEARNGTFTFFGKDLLLLFACFAVQLLIIILFVRLGNQLYFHFNPPRGVLIVLGSVSQEEEIRRKINRYQLQWRVEEAVLYNVPDLAERIRRADVVFLAAVPEQAKYTLLKICYDERKDVMCKAELQEIMLANARPAIVDDAAFLEMEYSKSSFFQRFVKRVGDIVLSALALVVLFPFMLAIFIAIKLEDGGPAIFRQERMTANGKSFVIRKFRTMKPDAGTAEPDHSACVDDPRVTRVGSFLRKYRLDELPQFYNILMGDMSLVGPRPEMLANVSEYKKTLPSFVYREKMKAGLTGYAQIEGRYNTSAEDKLMLDLMYIESFSLWLDIKLLLRTLTILAKPDSTQGFTAPAREINNIEKGEIIR